MSDPKKRCFRCLGRKKVYQLNRNGGYTLAANGTTAINCPLCAGMGKIDDVKKMEIAKKAKYADPKVEVNPDPVMVDSSGKSVEDGVELVEFNIKAEGLSKNHIPSHLKKEKKGKKAKKRKK